MIPRVLEPEAMDTADEASDYDAMDHSGVNERFVADFLGWHGPCRDGQILDVGTGPARIPIALAIADPRARILGIDLALHMLKTARQNVTTANLADRVQLAPADAKGIGYPDQSFEAVISNTIVHHIPDPAPALSEMSRVVAPGGSLFVRDLVRPETAAQVAQLVKTYAANEAPAARALFEASLNAALTVAEVRAIVRALGLPPNGVEMTSDRHWTWCWRRPT